MGHAMRRLGTAAMAALRQLRAGRPVKDLDSIRQQAATLLIPEAAYCGGAVLLAMAEALGTYGEHKDRAAHADNTCPMVWPVVIAPITAPPRHCAMPAPGLPPAVRMPICAPMPPASCRRTRGFRGQTTRCAPQANPLADTLVVLDFMPRPLPGKPPVPKIRAAWGDLLDQTGVPMVVAVGGGTGPAKLVESVVELPAPDDYEGLPQKILAIADWARTQTGFSRILKIDDDCFLDPEAFFADLSALCVPYYGRPLRRTRGEMDRAWHMGKATSARGRNDLDKIARAFGLCRWAAPPICWTVMRSGR